MSAKVNVFWSVLPERCILESPFIHFIQIAERCGQLGYHYIPLGRARTDIARDAVVSEFKKLTKEPDDILLMLDADHLHPTELPEILVKDNVSVACALAFRSNKKYPLPCIWTRNANGILSTPRTWDKGLIKVAVAGTAAIAIKRSVFTQLEKYDLGLFKYQYHPDGSSSSEEVLFCQILEREGIPLFVDSRIVTPHWTDGQIDESTWEKWLESNPEPPKKEHKVSVIIPQRGRFEKLKKCLESLKATAPQVEVIVITDIDESEALDKADVFPDGVIRICYGLYPYSAIEKWNHGAELATGDVLMLGANDIIYQPQWLESALEALDSLPNGEGVCGTNDMVTDGNDHSPHYLVSRAWLDKYYGGLLACPEYHMQFLDCDIAEVAKKTGQYVWAQGSKVLHPHPLTNTAEIDEIHQQGVGKYMNEDYKTFQQREKDGFPIIW